MLHGSDIRIGSLPELSGYLPGNGRVVLITETGLTDLLPEALSHYPVVSFPGGEEAKNWRTVQQIVAALLELEADRQTFLLGFGGGVVCDLTGFVASIFLRGCRFGFIPTTLLAQVDAAIGGKNGINAFGYKNILGTITAPDFVWCDPAFLHTLPRREFRSGLAEVIKAALLGDAALFAWLEARGKSLLQPVPGELHQLICRAVGIKVKIVQQDEREKNCRRLLNLGHTIGHAVESESGWSHGESVSIGMVAAAGISRLQGVFSDAAYARLVALLTDVGLPVVLEVSPEILQKRIRKDKKRNQETLCFVLPVEPGKAEIQKISYAGLEKWIALLCD